MRSQYVVPYPHGEKVHYFQNGEKVLGKEYNILGWGKYQTIIVILLAVMMLLKQFLKFCPVVTLPLMCVPTLYIWMPKEKWNGEKVQVIFTMYLLSSLKILYLLPSQ